MLMIEATNMAVNTSKKANRQAESVIKKAEIKKPSRANTMKLPLSGTAFHSWIFGLLRTGITFFMKLASD